MDNRADSITEKQKRRKENVIMVIQFTVLFLFLLVAVYGLLIAGHRSFIQGGDGYKQGYFWTVELKKQMESLIAGGGFSQWSWNKGIGMDVRSNYFLDPFNWVAASFPAGYIELGYTVAIVLKMYCGGLTFLAFIRYTGAKVFESVFGSACYVFSAYFIVTALIHGDGLVNLYMFPLLMLGTEMIYRKKTPAVFCLAVAYYLMNYFYYAYMAGITTVIYVLIRYFAYEEFSIKSYLQNMLRFAVWGLIGLCIAAVQLFVDIPALFEASTESSRDNGALLFDTEYYLQIGRKLIGTGSTSSYQLAGVSAIVIILAAVAFRRTGRKQTNVIMTILLFAALLIPGLCSVFNGFGYPTLRWAFMLVFFASWTAAEQLGRTDLLEKKSVLICILAFIVLAAGSLGLEYYTDSGLSERGIMFMSIQLAAGLLFVLILLTGSKKKHFSHLDKLLILLIITAAAGCSWSISFNESKGNFYRNNAINKRLQTSVQRAGSMIDDDSFYRIDQVDSSLYRHIVKAPPNESIWWQTKPIYIYNSRIPQKQLEFNRLTGNNYGYSKRVYILSNDNRTGLDYLFGVKYFLGDDSKYGATGSDEYAGYGFKLYDNIDGVNIFRSAYDVSLGYVFSQYMTESEFAKLSRSEREQALLQTSVVPDDTKISYAREVGASDIETAVSDVAFKIAKTDGIQFSDGKIIAEKDHASFTIDVGEVKNSQLILSIDGLLRDPEDGQSKSFVIHAKNEYVDEMADGKITNQSIPGVRDYDLNMGYYEEYSDGRIKVVLSREGTYDYESIRLSAMDAGLFDKYISALEDSRLVIDRYSDEKVSGTVNTDSPGILYLSISDFHNWDIYCDGKKADEIENLDISFFGAEIPAGKHQIELVYNNRKRKIGAAVSLLGLVILTTGLFLRNMQIKRRKKNEKGTL